MSESRAARCLAFLVQAEEVCQEEDALVLRIAASQREMWLEVEALKELFVALDRAIESLHKAAS